MRVRASDLSGQAGVRPTKGSTDLTAVRTDGSVHATAASAGPDGLDLGQDVVQVVQRLDARVQRVRVVADRRRRDDLQALVVDLGRVQGDVVDDDDDLRLGGLARVKAERAGATADHQADVAV